VPHARVRSLASPRRAVAEARRVVSCRVVSETETVTVRRMHCFCHSCRSFMSIIIFCIKTTSRDRDRDREAYALFLSFMSVIHVNHNLLY
jgi:hypothetical protein